MKSTSRILAWANIAVASALGILPMTSHATLLLAAQITGTTFTERICAADNNVGCTFNGGNAGNVIQDQQNAPNVLELGVPGGGAVNRHGVLISGSLHTATTGAIDSLDSNSLSVVNNSGERVTIRVVVGATGYSDANFVVTSASGTFSLSPTSRIDHEWYIDFDTSAPPHTGNGQGGVDPTATQPGTLVDQFTFFATGLASPYSHSQGPVPIAASGLYSIGHLFSFTLDPGGSLNSRGQLTLALQEVPEPASLALVGLGGLLLVRARRKQPGGG